MMEGDFFIGAALATTLTKLSLRYISLITDVKKRNVSGPHLNVEKSRIDTVNSLIPYDTRIVFDTRQLRCQSSLYKLKLTILLLGKKLIVNV